MNEIRITELPTGERKIPGSDKPVAVEPDTIIPVDPNSGLDTGESVDQIRARLDADLTQAIENQRSRKRVNPQSAIVHSLPTGRDKWNRR
jgi:hypothetical protein